MISKARQVKIQKQLKEDFKNWSDQCTWEFLDMDNIDTAKPLWSSIATTNPVILNKKKSAIRIILAFYKNMCSFKAKVGNNGCTHCALSMPNSGHFDISPENQVSAFKTAIKKVSSNLKYTPSVLEILGDGSFINDNEVSPTTQKNIINLISKNKSILRFGIESRIEYITLKKIKTVLKSLRTEQTLEIFIGLESIDPFVLDKIIKKGYTVKAFENKIKQISRELSSKERKRLNISIYHFFKPPYLSEAESIKSAVEMAQKAQAYEKMTDIKFFVKFEPAVVSKGTFQKYLYDHKKFLPPNYFSVAEIISKCYQEDLLDFIKFGQRDDIDSFSEVSAVMSFENPKMYSPFDFLVYNAVQRFNSDRDIWAFCEDISVPLINSKEFAKWEKDIYKKSGKSSLSQVFNKYKASEFNKNYKNRSAFQRKVWKVLDTIEYKKNNLLIKQSNRIHALKDVNVKIIKLFKDKGIKIYDVENLKFVDYSGNKFFTIKLIILNEVGLPQDIWCKIPLVPKK